MEQIIITKPDTTTWALMTRSTVTAVTRGEQKRALLGEDVINMTVESAIPLSFDIGDTINIFGSAYILNALPKFLKAGKRKFSYDITWESRQYDLLKPIYLDEGVDGVSISPDFSLTGTLSFFMNVLINNANRIFGAGSWVLGDCPVTDYRTLTFSNENCLAVLQRLCKQENFGKEFEIIEDAGACTINIKDAIGQNHATTYEYGKANGLFNLTRETVSENDIITRLYVFGANKNLKSDYRGYSQRLKLPSNDLSYIEDSAKVALYGLREGVKIFDEIFPHRTGTVSSLGATVTEFIDTSMDFDLNTTFLPGVEAKITFNTGNLAGYAFGVTAYDNSTKKFTLQAFYDERDQIFPDTNSAAFQVQVGDKYVITDIIMPQTYIDAAETELDTAGDDWYALVSQPRVQYSQDFDQLYFKQKYAGQATVNVFGIGDNVHIKDTDIDVDKLIRLRSFSRDLIRVYKYKLDLYDYSEENLATRLLSASNETSKVISSNKLDDFVIKSRVQVPGAGDLLSALLTVDGTGSGLDADLLDGLHASAFSLVGHIHDDRYYTETELNAGQLDNRYYTETEIDGFTVKLTGDQTIAGNKTFTGNIYGDYLISRSATYVSGFAGAGYKMNYAASKYDLEVDNLVVRNNMRIYNLEINKIKSGGGSFVISPASGVAYSVAGNNIYIDTDGGNKPINFAVNDYVRAQQWTGRAISSYLGQVTGVTQSATLGSAYITVSHVSGTPWQGAELVQVGNSSDTARQNLIYITASDTNNPYIDMLAGVNAGSFTGKQKLRIGNLTGINDAAFGGALSGYGMYSDNIYLKGSIVITGGSGYANISDKPTTLNAIESGTGTKLAGIAAGATVGATWGSNIASQPTTLAGVNSTEGTKLAGIAVGATVGATWGTNLNSIPTTLGAPSGSGLFLSATNMGYYTAGAWKTYIDSSGNMILGDIAGGNTGLSWNQGTGVLNIKGAINITSGSVPNSIVTGLGSLALASSVDLTSGQVINKSLANLDSTANTKLSGIAAGATVGATWGSNIASQPSSLSGINSGEGTKLSGIAAGATVGATWGTNLSNIPSRIAYAGTPPGAGLYIGDTYMGYYDGGTWKSYIDSYGNCTFVGVAEFGTATTGGFNLAMSGYDLWENAYNGNGSSIRINYKSYAGGNSYSRHLYVYDGRKNILFGIDGGVPSVNAYVKTILWQQVGIGDTPSANAILDIKSTTKHLVVPRMTLAQANSAGPQAGAIAYLTDLGHFYCYTNAWRIID